FDPSAASPAQHRELVGGQARMERIGALDDPAAALPGSREIESGSFPEHRELQLDACQGELQPGRNLRRLHWQICWFLLAREVLTICAFDDHGAWQILSQDFEKEGL